MPNRLVEGQPYKNRPAGTVPIQCSIEREALELCRLRLAGPRKLGAYVSRLIYEDIARKQERDKITYEERLQQEQGA